MWEIMGREALYVELAAVWKEQVAAAAAKVEGGERFNELLRDKEVTHLFNASTLFHTFSVELPEDMPPEDIQFMADVILDIVNSDPDNYIISLNGDYQPCQVVFSGFREPELIGLDKTEGYGSGNYFMPIIDSLSKPGRRNESMFQ
ncbi:MAG: hypothetical protein GX224_03790 [Thermoplasmatales archaeon]|nr:hypothetical protein [Thermoplasmatales archaeon]